MGHTLKEGWRVEVEKKRVGREEGKVGEGRGMRKEGEGENEEREGEEKGKREGSTEVVGEGQIMLHAKARENSSKGKPHMVQVFLKIEKLRN